MVSNVTDEDGQTLTSWQSLADQAHRILDSVVGLAGSEYTERKKGSTFTELHAALTWAENFLRGGAAGSGSGGRIWGPHATEVIIAEIAVIRNRLLTLHLAMQQEMMQGVNSSLERLRSAATVEEFAQMLPMEVVELGYVRSLFSWVADMQWVAYSAHSNQGEQESRMLVEAGRQDPLRDLRSFFEFEMIQERCPILKQNIRASQRVHPEIMNITQSDAYVASPVVVSGGVAGFVSVDVNEKTGTVDQFDRDLLGIFTSGAGIALERLRVQQKYSVESSLDELLPSGGRALEAPNGYLSSLTSRELEVLDLIARGYTNAQIAEVLFISEGTAKTHVRNLLRKLEVSNRTQAADLYRSQKPR